MILPGIQALFGFQLIAVFNQTFDEKLTPGEQILHLAAIGLVAIAVALVMTPAAYHRQAEPGTISKRFVRLSTWLLAWALFPLMMGICLDFYLIGRLILRHALISLFISMLLFIIFCTLWFIFPHLAARKSCEGK